MRSYQSLCMISILVSLLFSTLVTATGPITVSTIIQANLSGPTEPTLQCAKKRFLRTDHRPSFTECFRAIRLLPSSFDKGAFHNFGVHDGFLLPKFETFGRCRAQVDIGDREREMTSWAAVVSLLDHLNVLCRRQVSDGERTGGSIMMLPGAKIKVSLLGPKDPYSPGVLVPLNGTQVE